MKRIMVLFAVVLVSAQSFAAQYSSDEDLHLMGLTAKAKGDCRNALNFFMSETSASQITARWMADVADTYECLGENDRAIKMLVEFRETYRSQQGSDAPGVSERIANLKYKQVLKDQEIAAQRAKIEEQQRVERERQEKEAAEVRRIADEKARAEAEQKRQEAEKKAKEEAEKEEQRRVLAEEKMKFEADRASRNLHDLFLHQVLQINFMIGGNIAKQGMMAMGFSGKLYWFEFGGLWSSDQEKSGFMSATDINAHRWFLSIHPLTIGGWTGRNFREKYLEYALLDPFFTYQQGSYQYGFNDAPWTKFSTFGVGNRVWINLSDWLHGGLEIEYTYSSDLYMKSINIYYFCGISYNKL